jgi:hypothetical protein
MTAYTEADVERVARVLCRAKGIDPDSLAFGVSPLTIYGLSFYGSVPPGPAWGFFLHEAVAILIELSVRPIGWTDEDAPLPTDDPPAPKDLTEAWRLGCGLV